MANPNALPKSDAAQLLRDLKPGTVVQITKATWRKNRPATLTRFGKVLRVHDTVEDRVIVVFEQTNYDGNTTRRFTQFTIASWELADEPIALETIHRADRELAALRALPGSAL